MKEFSPLSQMTIEEKFYLFGDDTLIKTLDDEEYVYDKIVEEWTSSNLLTNYKEKEIKPKVLTKEEAEDVIINILDRKSKLKKELDFNFIEELVDGKREFILTDSDNNSFKIKKINRKNDAFVKYLIIFCMMLLLIGNIFTITRLLSNSDTPKDIDIKEDINNLTLKNIVILKGTSLPGSYSEYIEEKISDKNLTKLNIDTSSVNTSVPGMYTYKIKHEDKEYVGVVIVVNSEQEKNQTIDQLNNPDKYVK